MVVANEWNPDFEAQEAEGGGPKIFGVSVKDPRFMGAVIGVIGVGIAGFMAYNQLKPAIEKSTALKAEIEAADVKIKEQKKQIKERPKAEAEQAKAEKQREDVTSLFASEKTMKTLLYDINKLIDQINLGITQADNQAKMTKFEPVESKDGNYIINDSSLGPLVNGKLKRREFKVEFEGSYPQTRAFMIALERMQPLLVVKNFKTQLEQGNQVVEVEWRQNRFVPVSKPESRLKTSFDMQALLALSTQESLAKPEPVKVEDKQKKK